MFQAKKGRWALCLIADTNWTVLTWPASKVRIAKGRVVYSFNVFPKLNRRTCRVAALLAVIIIFFQMSASDVKIPSLLGVKYFWAQVAGEFLGTVRIVMCTNMLLQFVRIHSTVLTNEKSAGKGTPSGRIRIVYLQVPIQDVVGVYSE